ncbi:hypothetical protein RHSIM_Rhsim02G0027700 [Rhododendron simsii]|uniref:Uncharacterized protein n=1 Tax=Rhododendron simsii TaxID=118357 RepID=A0A834LVN4_RHOSS|nr:hypothetical protein RHSIM_Rhsim02G0027700 [Rhododendron simsii]
MRVAYEQWDRSNRLSLMLIKSHIHKGIRGSIPDCDKAKDFMKAIEEQFVSSDKALASTLMKKLSGMRHNSSKSVRGHIMEMRDIAAQLRALEIEISESFLVHFIVNSLQSEYTPFKISYNTHKEKWSVNELLTMCVQEEERLKHENEILESANLDSELSGSSGSRTVEFEELRDPVENSTRQMVVIPSLAPPVAEEQSVHEPPLQEEHVHQAPFTHNLPEQVGVRKSSRQRRPAISSDYLVYLQETKGR